MGANLETRQRTIPTSFLFSTLIVRLGAILFGCRVTKFAPTWTSQSGKPKQRRGFSCIFWFPNLLRSGQAKVESCSEDSSEALPQTKVAVSLRRDDSRIAAELDWHLKTPKNHEVVGNSAFFSRSEKATFEEILKLDSLSQVLDPKESDEVAYNPNFKS